jgi:hypothetical protein
VTTAASGIADIEDFKIGIHGPRQNIWYPMAYTWTNQLLMQNALGTDWFSFEPDYSDPNI